MSADGIDKEAEVLSTRYWCGDMRTTKWYDGNDLVDPPLNNMFDRLLKQKWYNDEVFDYYGKSLNATYQHSRTLVLSPNVSKIWLDSDAHSAASFVIEKHNPRLIPEQYDSLLLPICHEKHWTLLSLCKLNGEMSLDFRHFDSKKGEIETPPLLDSVKNFLISLGYKSTKIMNSTCVAKLDCPGKQGLCGSSCGPFTAAYSYFSNDTTF